MGAISVLNDRFFLCQKIGAAVMVVVGRIGGNRDKQGTVGCCILEVQV